MLSNTDVLRDGNEVSDNYELHFLFIFYLIIWYVSLPIISVWSVILSYMNIKKRNKVIFLTKCLKNSNYNRKYL